MTAGIRECTEALAAKRGISKSEAHSIMQDAVEVISDMCVNEGGVSFKGLFTIKKKVRKGRSGKCSFNDTEWQTEDRNTLSIAVGNYLDEMLN